ncbi:MAG: hypothetical protein ABI604_14395, partial [Nitrospirota bacterium]
MSANHYNPGSVSNPYGRYGNPYSPDSINNQFGAGDPYRSDSPQQSVWLRLAHRRAIALHYGLRAGGVID